MSILLRHATPARNVPSIQAEGLLCVLCDKSKGKLKAVWLHSAHKSARAILHVAGRHTVHLHQIVVFEVDIPRAWLRRSRRGLWYVRRDIPAERVRRLIGLHEIAA